MLHQRNRKISLTGGSILLTLGGRDYYLVSFNLLAGSEIPTHQNLKDLLLNNDHAPADVYPGDHVLTHSSIAQYRGIIGLFGRLNDSSNDGLVAFLNRGNIYQCRCHEHIKSNPPPPVLCCR